MKEKSLKIKVMSGLIWRFGERICAQLVSFLVSLVLARLIAPEEFGIVSLLLVFIEIANVFVVNGFGSALVQKKDADEIDFSTVLYFNVIFSSLLYVLIFCFANVIADFFDNTHLTWMLRILSLKLPLAAVNSVQQAYVQKQMIFRKFFFSTIIGTIVSAIVGIAMAFGEFGPWALICQYLTNSIMGTLVLWFTVPWRPKLVFSVKRLAPLFSFGWKILMSSLLHTFYTNLQSVVIGKKYTSSDLAYYNQGAKVPQLFVTNINSTITTVLFPAMAGSQDNRERLKEILRKTVRIGSIIMWPSMMGLLVLSETIVVLLFTKKWIACVPFFCLACIQFALEPVQMANIQAIKALGRSDLTLRMEIVKKGYGILALFLTMKYGVLAIAIAAVSQAFVALIVNTYPNRRLLDYTYKEQFADMLPAASMAILMAVCVYGLGKILVGINVLVALALQVFGGIVLYVVMLYIFQKTEFTYIVFLIKAYLKK